MAKFRDCKFEVTAEQIAFGAVAGAGIGLLALGVKKLFNAKNMKASRDYMKEYDDLFGSCYISYHKFEYA